MESIKSSLSTAKYIMENTRLSVPFAILFVLMLCLCIASCVVAAKKDTYRFRTISTVMSAVVAVLIIVLFGMKAMRLDRVPIQEHQYPSLSYVEIDQL